MKFIILSFCTVCITSITLFLFGQPLIAQSGKVYLWSSAGGVDYSQHVTDWYSFSHFLHGIIFFFLLGYIFKRFSVYKLFFGATILECSWELLENSPIIIEKYRQIGIAAGYFGDSVINSFFDIVCMMAGFAYARKFGWKISLVTFLALELFTLYIIRDNLTLNIIMLIHPFKQISDWQMGL